VLAIHHANAFLLIAGCATAGLTGLIVRRRGAGRGVTHLLALAQTLVLAQVLFGLLLLADHKRAHDRLHYAYGTFTLLCVFAPWLYAPSDPRKRLLWFSVSMLLAAVLGLRAYMTAT
jgi:hypothetical protein